MTFDIRHVFTHALVVALTVAVTVALVAAPASAAVPRTTSFQGILTDSGGSPIADGSHALHVRVYDAESAGNLLWNETHSVTTEGGLFSVILGSLTPLDIAFDGPTWISTEVDGGGEMSPRLPLSGAPYALTARTVEPGAIEDAEIANGTVVRGLNGLTDQVTISGNGGITVSEVGSTILIDGTGGGGGADSDWFVSGSTMYSIPQGNIGMGTDTPTSDLHIYDDNFATSLTIEDDTEGVAFHTSSLSLKTPVATGRLEFFTQNGTSTLNISNPIGPTMDIRLDGKEVKTLAEDAAVFDIAGNERMRLDSRLELYASTGEKTIEINPNNPGNIILQRTDNTGELALSGSAGFGAAITGDTDANQTGFLLRAERTLSGGGAIAWLYGDGQQRTVQLNAVHDGTNGDRGGELSLYTSGTPVKTVEIVAQETGSSTQGGQIILASESGSSTIELDGDFGSTNSGNIKLKDATGATTIELHAGDAGGGRVVTEVLEITGGADLSEHFDVSGVSAAPAGVEPGMVVSIDPANPGALVLSSTDYDTRVAGIISGAGGVRPGMLMGQTGSLADGAHPVALTGRVYAYADASHGAIEPGDLLTTSPTPGHAMTVTDRARAGGAILGKAMTALDDGRGLVLVLVALQ